MGNSLEVRVPFLDVDLVQFAFSIPSSLKFKDGDGKYIFKKALEPILPSDILYRPKQGFAVPLDRWFRNELRDMAHEAIFNAPDGILDQAYLGTLWHQHQAGRFNRARYLWAVLMFRKWKEMF